MRKSLMVAAFVLVNACAVAGNDSSQEVRSLAPGAPAAAATLSDLRGLVGNWVADGGTAAFSPAAAGQIVGHLALSMAEQPFVEELWIIRAEGASVLLRQKHFGADLKPLQPPERWMERHLVSRDAQHLFFEDLTFITATDTLVMKVKIPAAAAGNGPQVIAYSFHRVH